MEEEELWTVNIKRKQKRVNLKNLLSTDNNDFKRKNVVINKDYLLESFSNLLRRNFQFVCFNDNSHYKNFNETECNFIIENNRKKLFNLNNFSKIMYNNEIDNSNTNVSRLSLDSWTVITSFRIRNVQTRKILNTFIYSYEDFNNDRTLYCVMTYYDRNNVFLMLLTSYVEVLLYIYKIEIEMGKNPGLSKIINKYPYEFKDININTIKNYFNNLEKVWVNNK